MNDREALLGAIAAHPRENTPRLVFADWLDEHGESPRAEFIRLQCRAARLRPGGAERADALRAAEDLRADYETEWLGVWADRLVTWEYRRGFLRNVRLTAEEFLAHGEELFQAEPVQRLELVKIPARLSFDHGDPLEADAVRAVVTRPAFAHVRECAVVTSYSNRDVDAWLKALAAAPHVKKLRWFGPADEFDLFNPYSDRFGLDAGAVAAFCAAPHLRSLRGLDLGSCPIRSVPDPDRLVGHIAEAPFARKLRRLNLAQCRLTGAGFARLATDPAFARLRSLNVIYNASDEPEAWIGLFHSQTLKGLQAFRLSANRLPEFADAPLAKQVRDLTVSGTDEANPPRIRAAWLKLIATTPPPRKLELRCHHPGKAAFVAMRKRGWLRRVRTLAVQSDSQGGVDYGAGLRSLFGPRSMPRLAELDLHESGTPALLQALGAWPGLARLESLDLADDYHGRLRPAEFPAMHPLTCLRDLRGVIISTDEEIDQFLALTGLENVTALHLSLLGRYDRATFRYTDPHVLTEAAVERLLRSERLARVTDLTLGFGYIRRIEFHAAPLFADPTLLPRLRRLRLYVSRDGSSRDRPPVGDLRARFGLRLIAW